MDRLKLTFACGGYDRVEPLRTGRVKPKGIDLETVQIDDPRQLFDVMMQSEKYDVAEMSLSEHIATTSAGESPFVGLPVFPSKAFRHSFIVVNSESGIRKPKDLEGKRVGVPLYTMSAALWTRGMLEDDYGVDLSSITWVQGAIDRPGSHGSPNPPPLLKQPRIEINQSDKSLSDLLLDGEIDATLGGLMPVGFGGSPKLRRLFPNFREVERDYYSRTQIHPIMHIIVIRKSLYERHPWIAKSLYDAFEQSKAVAWRELSYSGTQKVMLPWLYADLSEAQEVFGDDPWPYGIAPNDKTITACIKYMKRQYMIAREPRIEELFVHVDTETSKDRRMSA
jgi:4,5-dihydroxyphthalate decarboxylase